MDKLISLFTSEQFTKDAKAILWQAGTMAIAGGLDLILQTLTNWDPENIITLLVGFIFARITKYLNK